MSFIEFKNVCKAFGEKVIYQNLNLQIEKGETLSILGGSGAGKSVMLKLLLGLLEVDSGEILFDGENIVQMDSAQLIQMRQRFGMLFQGGALFDSMSVAENISYPVREFFSDYDEAKIEQIVKEKLAVVGLSDIEELMPASLSGGMKKRVALARAIATDPEVILYDEPTAGLDPTNTNRIDELIMDLQKNFQVTSMVVTHNMKSAFKISNRIALLYNQKVEFVGSQQEVERSQNKIVRSFIDGEIGELK